ncbi:MAG: peptidoglycan-binding domain-containing protein [Patescibacteria group bacterium]
MRYFISTSAALSLLALGLVALPASAKAASLTDAQIQAVVDLVESFGADEAVVKNVEASLKGKSSSNSNINSALKTKFGTSTASTTDWLKLKAFLRMGSNGEDVRILQKILATDPSLYPEGLITGFFGPLTELAVKRLQAKLKIEQAGVVGPQTLARINELLAGITSEDLANSRVKIKIEIKNGVEKIEIEIKCDPSGSGNVCKDSDDDDDDEDEDEDEDDEEDDEDEDDDDDEDTATTTNSGSN